MLFKITGFLTAKGLAATGVAALALSGGGAALAAHQWNVTSSSLSTPSTSTSPNADGASSQSPEPSSSPAVSPLGSPFGTPGAHGQAVTSAVASCRAALTTGEHGIGACVSKVASSNGQLHRSTHPTPPIAPNSGGSSDPSLSRR